MTFSDLPLNPTRRMLRQFSVGWIVLCLVLAAVQWFRRDNPQAATVLALVSLVGVLGVLLPGAIRWLFIVVTVVTFPIGVILSNVLLALMFYLMMTPLGLVLRAVRGDALDLKRDVNRKSYWHESRKADDPSRYLKQY